MDSLTERITELSPERRRLLEHLLEQRGLPRPDDTRPAPPAYLPRSKAPIPAGKGSSRDIRVTVDHGASADDVKAGCRRFYDGVSEQLNSSVFGQFSYFLNYGYVADESPEFARVTLPEHIINRNSVKLVLELIGECELADRHILDVGCGRGGTVHVIDRFFTAASITGIDLVAHRDSLLSRRTPQPAHALLRGRRRAASVRRRVVRRRDKRRVVAQLPERGGIPRGGGSRAEAGRLLPVLGSVQRRTAR